MKRGQSARDLSPAPQPPACKLHETFDSRCPICTTKPEPPPLHMQGKPPAVVAEQEPLPSTAIAFCRLCHVRIYWREVRDSHEAAGHKVERFIN
jgi:hypothetical protein